MNVDFDTLSLTDLIKLQDEIAQKIRARFERRLAIVFADVVGSTQYFERFGSARGRGLLQRFLDQLAAVTQQDQGRIVDTAGDGAFCVYNQAEAAVHAMAELQSRLSHDNSQFSSDHHVTLRIGIHVGDVLTDGQIVTGEAVNLTARIAACAEINEIRLSQRSVTFLTPALRLRCSNLPPVHLKGIPEPVEMVAYEWRDPTKFVSSVRVEETGEVIPLPSVERIRFGRLDEHDGKPANEIILCHPDEQQMRRISRWQFELLRQVDGYRLKAVTRAPTEVNGQLVPMGQSVLVGPNAQVRVSGVLTLIFLSSVPTGDPGAGTAETLYGGGIDPSDTTV